MYYWPNSTHTDSLYFWSEYGNASREMHVQLEMVKNVPICKSYKNGIYGFWLSLWGRSKHYLDKTKAKSVGFFFYLQILRLKNACPRLFGPCSYQVWKCAHIFFFNVPQFSNDLKKFFLSLLLLLRSSFTE